MCPVRGVVILSKVAVRQLHLKCRAEQYTISDEFDGTDPAWTYIFPGIES